MRSLLAMFALAASAIAAPVPKCLKAKDEGGPLVGIWKPVGTSRTWFEFQPDGTMRCWTDGNERTAATYSWAVQPGCSPKRMTWQNEGKRWGAVYELDGEVLKIFYAHAKATLPDTVGPDPAVGNFEHVTRHTPAK
jgi:hypothetical protein